MLSITPSFINFNTSHHEPVRPNLLPKNYLNTTPVIQSTHINKKPTLPKFIITTLEPEIKEVKNVEIKVRPKHKRSKSVSFKEELEKVIEFDKTLCPLSINGQVPLTLTLPDLYNIQYRYHEGMLCLESLKLSKDRTSILGKVKVRNLDFHKKVHVRYTLDRWNTILEWESYYSHSLMDQSDIFQFDLPLPNVFLKAETKDIVHKMEICIKYQTQGNTFWDNNGGLNYEILVHPEYKIDLKKCQPINKSIDIPTKDNVLNKLRSRSFHSASPPPSLSNLMVNTNSNSPFSTRYSFDRFLTKPNCNKFNCDTFQCAKIDSKLPFGWAN